MPVNDFTCSVECGFAVNNLIPLYSDSQMLHLFDLCNFCHEQFQTEEFCICWELSGYDVESTEHQSSLLSKIYFVKCFLLDDSFF